jgi:glycosyltransferase involved in cell wall biosynthesis
MPAFTVFTPTYNRAHTLHRCYESLLAQTFRDFEWLIVDDGSTDNTAEVVSGWVAEGKLDIRYEPRPHQGAHHAYNRSLELGRGVLWIKLDSDDGLTDDGLERLWTHWNAIPEAQRAGFSGVTGLCRNQEGSLVGTKFPQDVLDCTSAELEYLHKVCGDKSGCLLAEILRQHPYPQNVPGNFIPESFIWSQVAQRYQTRHINEFILVNWTDAPSLTRGRSNPFINAAGHRLMFKGVLDLETRFFWAAPARLLRGAAQYSRFCFLLGISPLRQFSDLKTNSGRLLCFIGLLLGLLLSLRDRTRFSPASP